jgi:hypothetical protein
MLEKIGFVQGVVPGKPPYPNNLAEVISFQPSKDVEPLPKKGTGTI